MIRLENVSKTFTDSNKEVHAVNNVSLTINDGDIFGIIGFSGAENRHWSDASIFWKSRR